MPSETTFAGFAAHLRAMAARIPPQRREALREGAVVVETEAKRLPGTYDAGWPKLQPETITRKRTGDSPLLETGELRDSYQHRVLSDHEAKVGSNNMKAVWQEMGTSRGIPPRPVLLSAATRKEGEVRKVIASRFVKALRGS